MGVDSHSAFDIQRMCQLDIRKLLFVIIPVAAIVLMVQFLSIPYGSVLLTLFPTEKVPLLAQTEHSAGVTSPEAEVVYGISLFNASSSSNSSSLVEVIQIGNSSREPIPIHDLPSENVSFDDVQKENNLTLERSQGRDSGSTSLAPAIPPVAPSSIPAPLVVNLSIPSVEQSTTMLSNDQTTEILEKSRDYSQKHVNLSSISVMNDKTDMPTGRGNAKTNLRMGSKSTQKDSLVKQTDQGTLKNVSNMTTNSVQIELTVTPVKSLSDMYLLLEKSHTSSRSMVPRWPSVRDMEILSAKSQIENPPMLKKDRQLYAPLFRNISKFKRSYELMEKNLKVYTYKEGAQPIFHRPETKGIYASEGWFMKQMEGNKKFSVNDPRKAHLFYLPFSSRRLEQFLYVPDSHSHKNLVAYLKSYLDLISSKYPFWNRTGGADHFLVGCHDWAPAETRQYMNTCIRALCNADIGYDFTMGKDVSLPETHVRLAKDPVRDLGGKPVPEREILAFFAGSMHGYVRPILLKYWENKDPDMKIYNHMGRGKQNRVNYVQNMKNSKYCICAKGYEVNSPRVVEAIFYECVPVIISDNFVPPFFEVLNWEAFAIFVPEKDIPNLKNILLSISSVKYLKLQMNVRRVQQHFLWHTKPVKYDIFHMILHSVWYSRVFQINVA